MKNKSKWWLSLTKKQQHAYVERKVQAKARLRTPEWRREKYEKRGYSKEEIDYIMGAHRC
jgi:hypothetical protein